MNEGFFVGIGAQRAGTTWLGEYFKHHPQVGFSPIKELHYFDAVHRKDLCSQFHETYRASLTKLMSRTDKKPTREEFELIRCLTLRVEMTLDENKYRDYFDLISENGYRVVGEITPSYSLLDKNGFLAIKKLFKDAKFIFILRDPVDRYWSHLKFREARLGTDKFCAEKNISKCLSSPRFFLRTDYRRTLDELYKVVPKEDVCVVFFENLMSKVTQKSELNRITDFLNIDFIEGDLTRRINASKYLPMNEKFVHRVVQEFSEVYEYIYKHFPDRLPDNWKEKLSILSA